MRPDRRKKVPESWCILEMEPYLVLRPGSGKVCFAMWRLQVELPFERKGGKIGGNIHRGGSKNRHCSRGRAMHRVQFEDILFLSSCDFQGAIHLPLCMLCIISGTAGHVKFEVIKLIRNFCISAS